MLNDTHARLIWSEIEGGVRKAIDGTPGNEIEDIKRFVMSASARVIGIYDKDRTRYGSIIYLPMGDMAYILSIEGRHMINADNNLGFEAFMRSLGYKSINCLAGPVQSRLWKRLGYSPIKTLLEKDIWVEQSNQS